MSRVHNVVLLTMIDESGVAEIERWLEKEAQPVFARVDQYAGGRKVFEADLFAMAFNYFPISDFLAMLPTVDWEHPENVSVLIEPPEGPHIRWSPA